MGNVIGISPSDNQEAHRAALIDEIVPFDNLSIHEVEVFWRNFFDHASGFAMSKPEFTTMCISVACQLNKSPNQMAHDAGVLFDELTRESDAKLLDALEFLASIVFICTAPLDDKIDLVYDSWDMSEDNGLQIDEVVISLKSTLLGLAKIIVIDDKHKTMDMLDDEPIKRLAEMAFRDMLHVSPSTPICSDDTISCDVFHAYCLSNADVKDLFVWFDAVEQDSKHNGLDPFDIPNRSLKQVLQMDPDSAVEKDLTRLTTADHGDEFLAVKPWEGAIVAPSKVPPLDASAPVLSLSLHWIYGYHAQDAYARNNVRYSNAGEIVYTAASVGVVLNAGAKTQRHLLAHTDDVLSIAMHPSKGIAATGETGKTPKLIVWDIAAVKPLVTLRGYHSRGIIQLAFSTIGNELASVGADDNHSIGVYTTRDMWHTAELTWFAKGNKAVPLHVVWHPTDAMHFCILGVKYIEFWEKEKCNKGIFGKKGKLQPLLCGAWVTLGTDMTLVVGTSDGALYLFQRPDLRSIVENAHAAAVQTMYAQDKTLITGGKEGLVKLWVAEKTGLTCLSTFDCNVLLHTTGVVVQSVCLSSDGSMVLLGTQSSEIYELNVKGNTMSAALMCGHSVDELWGLATHPTKQEAATVGDDRWLRVWDLVTRTVLRSVRLECMARAVAYSPDGKLLAVGLGGQVPGKDKANKHPKCGGVVVLVESDLSKVYERNDTKKWIADVKFSPTGRTLAIASHDSSVVLYDLTKQCAKKHAFKKHSSFVSHVDFSADGSFLQSISGAYELLYCDVKSGKQVTSASAFKDEQWATWTCILGWPVQGMWQPEADGSDINAVDRSHSGSLLATADDFGKVKVFRYPCVHKHAGFVDFLGHSSHVTNVRWSAGDRFLLSTGGQDRCLFQWRHDSAVKQPTSPLQHSSNTTNHHHVSHELSTDDDDDVEFQVAGDEFMAVKPWVGAIVPPSVLPMVDNAQPPATTLALQHVHGYQGQNALNNVRYMEANRIVYHAAALGIVFDASNNSQQFFQEHDDDIVGLALHPNRKTVATGQMGKVPKIHVWELGSRGKYVSLACLQGFHKRAVPVLSFSTDGTTLASMGNDDDHSIAIYKWKEGVLVASSKGVRNTLMHLTHYAATNEWISLGDKTITFWAEQGRNLNGKKAILGKNTPTQVFYCAIAVPTTGKPSSKLIVGAHDGSLYVLDDKNVSRVLKAHTGPAYALFASPTKAEWISGGKDGKVIVWDANLSALHSFDIAIPLTKLFNLLPPDASKKGGAATSSSLFGVRSVCFNSEHTRILLGTSGSDVVQFDRMGTKATVVTQGHCQDELWGLAVHPAKPEYCTVGDDKTLRVWSTEHRLQLRVKSLECVARACAYSNAAPFCIAVGFGGRIGKRKKHVKEGGVVVFSADSLEIVFEDKPSKEWISEIKFSPNNATLAVGSHDNAIYLYAIRDNRFTKVTKVFRGHNSYITHLDFSTDGKYLQSNCGAYELLFSDANTGKQVTSARSLRDVQWHTWTCALGWPVQGIWPACADGTDINAVHRCHSGELVATGDDFGQVKLFRYPAVAKHSVSYSYAGHSSHVTNVRWLGNDTHVITTGGLDRTIMQWKHVQVEGQADDNRNDKTPLVSPSKPVLATRDEDPDEDDDDGKPSTYHHAGTKKDTLETVMFGADAGDEFMAVKPWIGAIAAPSNPPKENPREPELTMRLEWVFGYQTELSRNNLRYNADGQIVYHAAAVGIVYDRDTNTQKHHVGHSDDILCMAMSPSGRFVATGERGKKPSIRVWDAKSGATLCVLTGFHARGVVSVTFSHDEKTIASVGDDDDHSLAIWEDKGGAWSNGRLVTTSKGDKNVNLFAIALPRQAFVTGGVKHILFWTLQGKTVSHVKGQFGKLATQQPLLCACSFYDQTTLTGADNGDLYHWTGHTVTKSVKAHDGSLSALFSVLQPDKSYTVVSGGKDGKVCVWNQSLQQTSSFSIDASGNLSSVRAKTIKSVALDSTFKKILVGTLSSDAFEVEVGTGALLKTVAGGHFMGETWGLAVHPLDPTAFVTVGDDKIARMYDRQAKTSVVLMELEDMARAIAFSPHGTMLAIGYGGDVGRGKKKGGKVGAIGFYEHPSTTIVFEDHPSKAAISDVKFNASGTMAAFGSHDSKIYLYAIDAASGGIHKHKVFDAHKSSITHVDFSRDGKYLQSNCSGYELLFCDTTTGKQMKSARALKDVVWDTWTCVLGWPVQGIWPEFADGTDVNATCASTSRTFVATGDDSSNVKVFRYPCLTKGAKWIAGQGHCSHVTNVRFTQDDKYIVSTGGNDRTTMMWRLSD